MVNKESAKSIEFEINLLKLSEERLGRKFGMNVKLGEGSKVTLALNELNNAIRLIEDSTS